MIDFSKKKCLINLILITMAVIAFLFVQFFMLEKTQIQSKGLVKRFYTETAENIVLNTTSEDSKTENKTDEEKTTTEEVDEDGTRPQTVFSDTVPLVEGNIDININAINIYSDWKTDAPILVHGDGKTVKTATGSAMSFAYWDFAVVEYKDSNYVVTELYTEDGAKNTIQVPTGGFVIMFYYESGAMPAGLKVGDYVIPNFDYKSISKERNLTGKTITITDKLPTEEPEPEPASKLEIIPNTINTSDFMKINLYDYTYVDANNHINSKYLADNKFPGFQNSTGVENFSNSKWGYGFDSNIVADYKAKQSNVTTGTATPITINSLYDGDYPLGYAYDTMQPTLGADGYPALSDGTSLGYLFGAGNESYVKRINSNGLDGLFQYDEEKQTYWFDSRTNHAQYNSQTNRFDLYKQAITSNFMTYPFGSFLPFNDINVAKQSSSIDNNYWQETIDNANKKAEQETDSELKTAYTNLSKALTQFIKNQDRTGLNSVNAYFKTANGVDNAFDNRMDELDRLYNINFDDMKNYFFGLNVSLKFVQSENGWCTKDNTPREFYFVGDDDVWIYIDNVLFLDLSGIHRHVGGKIDFHDGKVYYYKSKSLLYGDVDEENPIKVVNFSDLIDSSKLSSAGTFKDNTVHKIDLFYMERGSGSSVCNIKFNVERNYVQGKVIWEEDTEDTRPTEVKIHLLQDGKRYAATTTDASRNWKYTFEEIPFFATDGTAHVYSVEEETIKAYEVSYIRDDDEDHTIDIVNTYKYKDISVQNVWDDKEFEGRPNETIVELSATVDGNEYTLPEKIVKNVVLNNANNWQYTWENLDRFFGEKEIVYSVKQLNVPEGYFSNTVEENDLFTITNTKYRTITLNLYEKNNYDKKLPGAEFKLEKLVEETGEWVTEKTGITSEESDKLGQIIFDNLEYGNYRLTQTKSPNGYQLLKKPVEVEVNSENLNFEVNIENRKGIILPNTGANTKIVILLVAVLAIFVIYKKYMRVQVYSNRKNLRIVKSAEKHNLDKKKKEPRISG